MDPLSAIQRAAGSRWVRAVIVVVAVAIVGAAAHRLQVTAPTPTPASAVTAPAAVDPAQRAHLDELEQAMREVAKQPPQPISPDGLRALAERWTAKQTDATRPFEPERVEGVSVAVRDRNSTPREPQTREERLRFAAVVRSFLVSP